MPALRTLALRYELLAELGRGAFGTVYRARDRETEKTVAVKVFHDPDAAAGTEFETLSRLDAHPGVVRPLDVGRLESGKTYIVMELVPGADLRRSVPAPADPGVLALVSGQVARALEFLHGRRIVHRDLKPENILISREAQSLRARLVDVGLALVGEGRSESDQASISGTAAYLAPEQIRGEAVDGRVDLHALGVILSEFLTGRRPYRGATRRALFRSILQDDPPPLLETRPGLDPRWGMLVGELLAKDPARRPDSVTEVAQRLEALAGGADPITLSRLAFVQDPPLVGRDAHLEAIEAAHSRASWNLVGVALSGPRGSGRSRLLKEARLRFVARGHLVIPVACRALPPEPLAMWRLVLRRLRQATPGHVAWESPSPSLHPLIEFDSSRNDGAPHRDESPAAAANPPGPEEVDLFLHAGETEPGGALASAVGSLIERLLGPQPPRESLGGVEPFPVTLLLDDADALDRLSRLVLDRLRHHAARGRLLIAGTWEVGGSLPEGWAEIAVEPLDETAVAMILKSMLPELSVDSDLAAVAWKRSAGLPHALESWVRSAFSEEPSVEGDWRRALLAAPPATSVTEDLERRMRRMQSEALPCGAVFSVLCLFGAPMSVGAIAACTELDPAVAMETLEALRARHGLVERWDHAPGSYVPAHPSHSDAFAGTLPEEDRRGAHRRIAGILERGVTGEAPPPAELRWRHWREATDTDEAGPEAVAAALDAAREAMDVGAWRRAYHCLDWARQRWPRGEREVRRGQLLSMIAAAARGSGRSAEAAVTYVQAAECMADGEARAELLRRAAGVQLGTLGNLDLAERLLDRAARTLEAAPRERGIPHALLARDRGEALRLRGRYEAAEARLEEGLATLSGLPPHPRRDETEALLRGTLASLHTFRGRFTEAEPQFLRSLELARRAESLEEEARTLTGLSTYYGFLGRYREALRYTGRSLELGELLGDLRRVSAARHAHATTSLYLGRLGEGRRQLDEGEQLARRIGDRQILKYYANTRGMLAILAGNLDEAEQAYRHCRELSRELGHRLVESLAECGLARVALARGRVDLAAQALARADVAGEGVDEDVARAQRLVIAATVDLENGDPARAGRTSTEAVSLLQGARSVKFRAPAHLVRARSLDALGATEDAAREALRAEDFANLVEVPEYQIEALLLRSREVAPPEGVSMTHAALGLADRGGYGPLRARALREAAARERSVGGLLDDRCEQHLLAARDLARGEGWWMEAAQAGLDLVEFLDEVEDEPGAQEALEVVEAMMEHLVLPAVSERLRTVRHRLGGDSLES